MQGKGFFNTYAVRYLPHGKSGTHIAFSTPDNNALKDLHPFLVAFNDTNMDPD
jgi:hypothetical protein